MKKKNFFYPLLILILIFPAAKALFHPGFFPSHDGEWMIVRLSDFHRSLVSGQFPARWAARLNHQFGYPVFNFLYPLSLYFGETFHLLGLDFIWSIKAVFIASFIFSGLFMFLWIKKKWGRLAGLLAGCLYVYTPYRLVDVYVRGSLGETLAFVWPPLLFWMTEKTLERKNWKDVAIGSLALAALITSHNTQALLFTGLLIVYLLYLSRCQSSQSTISHQLLTILFGLGLSAFFWLPALYDKQFVIFDQVLVSNFFAHFPTLSQLIIPSWGYGPSLPSSAQDTISFQVGILNLIVGSIALVYWLKNRKKETSSSSFFVFTFWIAFLLMLPLSFWVWRILLVYNLIQFPWRLLSLTTFASSILAGFIIFKSPQKWQLPIVLIATLFLIFQARIYAQPEYFINRPLSFYTTNEASTNVSDEYTSIWVKEPPLKRAEKRIEIIKGKGEIKEVSLNSKKISFQLSLVEPGKIRLNIHYFPGWQLFINSQRQAINFQDNGLIEFSLPQGEFAVLVSFGETPIRLLANFVSLISLMMAGFCIIKKGEK